MPPLSRNILIAFGSLIIAAGGFLLYFAYTSRIQVESLVWVKGEIEKHDLVRNTDTGSAVYQESLQIRLKGRSELFRVENASAESFLLNDYKKSNVAEVEILVRDLNLPSKNLTVQIFSLKIAGQTLLRTEDVIAAGNRSLMIVVFFGGVLILMGAGIVLYGLRFDRISKWYSRF